MMGSDQPPFQPERVPGNLLILQPVAPNRGCPLESPKVFKGADGPGHTLNQFCLGM